MIPSRPDRHGRESVFGGGFDAPCLGGVVALADDGW
jgi:hypothetical protein